MSLLLPHRPALKPARRALITGAAAMAAYGSLARAGGVTHVVRGPGAPTTPTGPHRYWRINFNGNDGASGSNLAIGLSRMEAYSSIGGDNLLISATITASDTFTGLNIANIFDEIYTNVWGSTAPNVTPSVTIDFGAGNAQSLVKLMLMARADSNFNQAPVAFTVWFSDDGTNWTTAWSVSGSTGWVLGEQRSYLNPSYGSSYTGSPWGTHTAYRIVAIAGGNNGVFACAELKGFAVPAGSNEFVSGTPSASSSFSSSFLPANAFDGNPSTAWASNVQTAGQWLEYVMGSAAALAQVSYATRNDSAFSQGMTRFLIQYTPNGGTNWTTMWQVLNTGTWTIGQVRTFTDPLYI